MSQDVTSYWLFGIDRHGHASTRVCHDLVSDEDSHVELLGQFMKFAQYFTELLLSICQLPSSTKVYSEWSHNGVNNDQSKRALHHQSSCLGQKVPKQVTRIGICNHNVLQALVWVKIESFCD